MPLDPNKSISNSINLCFFFFIGPICLFNFISMPKVVTVDWSSLSTHKKRYICTGWPKKLAHFVLYASTSSNIDRFSNLFHYLNQGNIRTNTVTKDPTTPQVCRYTTLWNVNVLKATTENNTTSVTTHLYRVSVKFCGVILRVCLAETIAVCDQFVNSLEFI